MTQKQADKAIKKMTEPDPQAPIGDLDWRHHPTLGVDDFVNTETVNGVSIE